MVKPLALRDSLLWKVKTMFQSLWGGTSISHKRQAKNSCIYFLSQQTFIRLAGHGAGN